MERKRQEAVDKLLEAKRAELGYDHTKPHELDYECTIPAPMVAVVLDLWGENGEPGPMEHAMFWDAVQGGMELFIAELMQD